MQDGGKFTGACTQRWKVKWGPGTDVRSALIGAFLHLKAAPSQRQSRILKGMTYIFDVFKHRNEAVHSSQLKVHISNTILHPLLPHTSLHLPSTLPSIRDMSTNQAAWALADRQHYKVQEAPYTKPKAGEIVVKNQAVAINPVDWIMQTQGTGFGFRWIKYPFIFGNDVAGEVVEVGSEVTRFKVGDRVVGQAYSTDEKINNAAYGAFQQYVVLLERTSSPIPDTLSFEAASVFPLALTTAAAGLFEKDQLGLESPQLHAKSVGKTVLVWGGSTSVGCNAIQLAVAAGYEVVSTSSPKNFDLLKSLGAAEVFDYKDAKGIDKIVGAMEGKHLAGAMAIGENSMFRCLDVLGRCQGDKRLAMVTFPIPSQPKRFATLQIIYHAATSMISIMAKSKLHGIRKSIIWGSVAHSPVADVVYRDFLPEALANGKFRATPEPFVVGEGLETIQEALNIQKKGVSAKKIVVSLS
jgi:NADPH:quinone reductase-like Zn-dependent oxidoreductase